MMIRFSVALLIAGAPILAGAPSGPANAGRPNSAPRRNTFSIVAHDPVRKEWGVGTASRVLAVGAGTPWAKAGAGAIATQAAANVTYGPRGLELLAKGRTAQEVVKLLIREDKTVTIARWASLTARARHSPSRARAVIPGAVRRSASITSAWETF